MRRQILVGTLMFLALAHSGTVLGEPTPRQPAQPIPWGQRIAAQDGDVILLDDEARVRIVRRRQAIVRTIANASEQWLVALVDFVPRNGSADGQVDRLYIWRQTQGGWPIAERWEGGAILEEYSAPGQNPGGIGLVFPAGRVQLLSGGGTNMFADSQAIAIITHRNATSTIGNGASFDEAEQRALADIAANPRPESITTRSPGGMATVRMETGALVTTDASATYSRVSPGPATGGPVRVGGNIAGPRKIHDVAAVRPEAARQAGVAGVVILEITVGVDGSVTEAHILRGFPLLDQAALDAARQWRYEPTLLNGTPVPVRLTAPVNFPR